ncbi:MAG: DUF547 domain-containing protein [Desulfobacterales bacterium]
MTATADQTAPPALLVLLLAVFLCFMPLKGAAADAVDHALFAELLAEYVRGGEVDYAGFKSEEKTLDRYLFLLEQTDPGSLGRDDQFAFYINTYNAWTIKLILTGYPGLKSIKDLGTLFQSPWKKKIVRIHGETLSLDDVEHKILRPRFKDPRVHFAINCASRGCPPLISEPYRGAALSEQLEKVTREFLNTPQNYRLEGDTFWVSALFKWFPEDFDNDPAGFYRGYAEGDLKRLLEEKRDRLRLRYLDYDWSLNGA